MGFLLTSFNIFFQMHFVSTRVGRWDEDDDVVDYDIGDDDEEDFDDNQDKDDNIGAQDDEQGCRICCSVAALLTGTFLFCQALLFLV